MEKRIYSQDGWLPGIHVTVLPVQFQKLNECQRRGITRAKIVRAALTMYFAELEKENREEEQA